MELQRLRDELGAALDGAPTPLAAADRLCAACVELLDVDGASISLIADGMCEAASGSDQRGELGGCGVIDTRAGRRAALTASEVAYQILNRQLIVSADDWYDGDHRRET